MPVLPRICVLLPLAAIMALSLGAASAPAPAPAEKRELLSEHQTVAKLKSIAFQRCRGLTTMCPDNCGHSGDFATFDILAYIKYSKPGEYGDPKTATYTFQLDDNKKNLKLPKATVDKVRALKPGDFVLLSWNHDYVTQTGPGGSGSFPERPLTKLEPISAQEADKLIKAGEKP